ncbi:MAG: argininosuccinate lyase [Saprospiraceae bacterium]
MKLWDKGYQIDDFVDQYTVGNDRDLDQRLAKYDLQGSRAHAHMLRAVGLLTEAEEADLQVALQELEAEVEADTFTIGDTFEDVHSYVEYRLTQRVGDAGKKIHMARSRNDQVLVDLHLFAKAELAGLVEDARALFDQLLVLAEAHKDKPLPGYTHMQVAMPSSFGLWFGAYAETLIDDLYFIKAASRVADQNPLGSGAGYGSSFPIDRDLTTSELGLAQVRINVVAAQMSRGKLEQAVASACAAVSATLSKMAADMCLYMSQNFGFVRFPPELTTGSSIMPHKQNPDVWEVMRARSARIMSIPGELALVTSGLTSGYHRDMQVLKSPLMEALDTTRENVRAATFMLAHIQPQTQLTDEERYDLLFTVEEVNRRVLAGEAFRDAYKAVGESIFNGSYTPNREVKHTHLGSIGNLGLERIREKWEAAT